MVDLKLDEDIIIEVKKISFKNNQAWLSMMNDEGTYIGTLHIISRDFCKKIIELMPTKVTFTKDDKY